MCKVLFAKIIFGWSWMRGLFPPPMINEGFAPFLTFPRRQKEKNDSHTQSFRAKREISSVQSKGVKRPPSNRPYFDRPERSEGSPSFPKRDLKFFGWSSRRVSSHPLLNGGDPRRCRSSGYVVVVMSNEVRDLHLLKSKYNPIKILCVKYFLQKLFLGGVG